MDRCIVLRCDDWEGVYLDGVLQMQDHSIDNIELANFAIENDLTQPIQMVWADLEWMEDRSDFPDSFADVILGDS